MSGFSMRPLGKTGLQVSPLGIGGGAGISSENLLYAFERGINYFFFSSDMHHFAYQRSAEALRTLCGQGSAVRDRVVLATVSYVNHPDKLPGVLIDQFAELGIDYIDVFHWGWITDDYEVLPLMKSALKLKEPSAYTRMIRQVQAMHRQQSEQAQQVNEELLKRGLARAVGMSFHSRVAARTWMRNLDVLMLRYNLAHLGIEEDVVPFLFGDKARDPGIVVFNVAHEGVRSFHQPPPGYPTDGPVPSIPDCYRFALSNPWVDVVLAGLSNRAEIDLALAAVEQGCMSAQECAFMRRYGNLFKQGALAGLVQRPALAQASQ
jgi:aryl-alcohol dehydrogenase-like predicted oxidoreductase